MEPALYLIPVTLGATPLEQVLPAYNRSVILGIRHFIVEEVRSARRFLKQVDRNVAIDALEFYPWANMPTPRVSPATSTPFDRGIRWGSSARPAVPP